MNFIKIFFLYASLFCIASVYSEVMIDCIPQNECCRNIKQIECFDVWANPIRGYLDHVEGRWLDNRDGYTSLGLFLALPNLRTANFISFIDARLHVFNNGKTAGNFGGGLRYIDPNSFRTYGVNAFYDYRKASWNRYFQQVGMGLEMLSSCWDLRLNGYFSVGERGHSKRVVFDSFVGDFIATCQQRRSGSTGADIELGSWLLRRGPCDYFDLYAAIGSYYYSSRRHGHNMVGGEVRVESNICRYLNLEVRGGYDRVFRGNVQGRIALVVPFDIFGAETEDCCCVNNCCLTYPPVRRQEIIVLNKKQCCWTWNWDDCGH